MTLQFSNQSLTECSIDLGPSQEFSPTVTQSGNNIPPNPSAEFKDKLDAMIATNYERSGNIMPGLFHFMFGEKGPQVGQMHASDAKENEPAFIEMVKSAFSWPLRFFSATEEKSDVSQKTNEETSEEEVEIEAEYPDMPNAFGPYEPPIPFTPITLGVFIKPFFEAPTHENKNELITFMFTFNRFIPTDYLCNVLIALMKQGFSMDSMSDIERLRYDLATSIVDNFYLKMTTTERLALATYALTSNNMGMFLSLGQAHQLAHKPLEKGPEEEMLDLLFKKVAANKALFDLFTNTLQQENAHLRDTAQGESVTVTLEKESFKNTIMHCYQYLQRANTHQEAYGMFGLCMERTRTNGFRISKTNP